LSFIDNPPILLSFLIHLSYCPFLSTYPLLIIHLSSPNAPLTSKAHQLFKEKLERERERVARETEDTRQHYIAEIASLKSSYEVEGNRREQHLLNAFEQQKLDLLNSSEQMLNKRDGEIASILKTLDEKSFRLLEVSVDTAPIPFLIAMF
jgi:superfamily I DNA and/or RNA helicase